MLLILCKSVKYNAAPSWGVLGYYRPSSSIISDMLTPEIHDCIHSPELNHNNIPQQYLVHHLTQRSCGPLYRATEEGKIKRPGVQALILYLHRA